MILEWHDSYCINHPLIDEEHKELLAQLRVVQRAREARDEELARFETEVLLGLLEQHFMDEERVMAQVHYPQYEAHRALHAALRDRAKYLWGQADMGCGKAADNFYGYVLAEVVTQHMLVEDQRLRPFLSATPAS